ncbi:helix-hairpin-helix domain-containing protein [bacterium]|nr:helix-hairpin-helix domain-containing protein [bacterium]
MRYSYLVLLLASLTLWGKVNINTASESELTSLPGVGASKAKNLIEYREIEGEFTSINEILNVPGFSEALLSKISDQITVSGGSTSTAPAKTDVSSNSSTDKKIDDIMKRFSNEPSITEVQREALKYAHIDNETYDSWIGRAKNQSWLPKMYVKGRTTSKERVGYDQDTYNLGIFDNTTKTTNKDDYIEGRVEFDLRELVFHPDELRVNKEILSSVNQRKKLLEGVTKIYFDRRKNQIDLILNPPKNAKGLLNAKMKIQEQTSILDALTNGYFTKNIK